MARRLSAPAALSCAVGLIAGCAVAAAPDQATDPRIERGAALYETACASCHGTNLMGGRGPSLVGDTFWSHWHDKTARKLYSRVLTTMPPTSPGTLAEQDVIDIVAYVLSFNGVNLPETSSADGLNEIVLTKGIELLQR